MSEESLDLCRLCSAPDNLICMFTGKQRNIRDSLRKMIKETVNIQIEQNQGDSSVCFNCLVDITHFYYFRLQCHQNQSNFKTKFASHSENKQKNDSLSVDKLSLPEMDSTLRILEWLLAKRQSLSEYNGYSVPRDRESQTWDIDLQSQGIQTAMECSEKSIQTENFVVLKQQSVQTVTNTKDNYSQTVKTQDNKCCQTDSEANLISENVSKVPTVSITRSLRKRREKNEKKTAEAGIQEVVDDKFFEPLKTKHISNDMECQTDMTVDPTVDFIASNCFLGREFKSPISDIKMDFKEETLSPYEHLMISTPPLSDEIKSPSNCSNLLKIHEGKSQKVFTCTWCDKAMYNKRELRAHKKIHLFCSICKKKFRSIKRTNEHINECKLTKLNKPSDWNFNAYVSLIKIEKDSELKTKFPNVFEN